MHRRGCSIPAAWQHFCANCTNWLEQCRRASTCCLIGAEACWTESYPCSAAAWSCRQIDGAVVQQVRGTEGSRWSQDGEQRACAHAGCLACAAGQQPLLVQNTSRNEMRLCGGQAGAQMRALVGRIASELAVAAAIAHNAHGHQHPYLSSCVVCQSHSH